MCLLPRMVIDLEDRRTTGLVVKSETIITQLPRFISRRMRTRYQRADIRAALDKAVGILAAVPGVSTPSAYVRRHEFELDLIVGRKGTDVSLWDIGGGLGVFPLAAACLGMRATIVDDFYDLAGTKADVLTALRHHGVRVIEADLPATSVTFDPGIDVITSLHTIEHMHHSPRRLYHDAAAALAGDGLLILAGPNAVNLRKRLTVPFGRGEWSSISDWYETAHFRAHVREPRVQDFQYIARDLGLTAEILGRNFLGNNSTTPSIQVLARWGGPLLERRPSLCSDLYLLASRGS